MCSGGRGKARRSSMAGPKIAALQMSPHGHKASGIPRVRANVTLVSMGPDQIWKMAVLHPRV